MTFDLDLQWWFLHPGNSQWLQRTSFFWDYSYSYQIQRIQIYEPRMHYHFKRDYNMQHSISQKMRKEAIRLHTETKTSPKPHPLGCRILFFNRLQTYHHTQDHIHTDVLNVLPLQKTRPCAGRTPYSDRFSHFMHQSISAVPTPTPRQ